MKITGKLRLKVKNLINEAPFNTLKTHALSGYLVKDDLERFRDNSWVITSDIKRFVVQGDSIYALTRTGSVYELINVTQSEVEDMIDRHVEEFQIEVPLEQI